jgi:hypothetical protein
MDPRFLDDFVREMIAGPGNRAQDDAARINHASAQTDAVICYRKS